MTELEIKDEKEVMQSEYNALKKHLGELLLEHNGKEENPEEFAYYSRKFKELQSKIRGK